MRSGRPPKSARPPKSLQARAIGLLARREYARAELRERLLATGADRTEVDAALDRLEKLGYLSDARFATGVVRQKAGAYSKRAIAHALKEKGVASSAAKDALAALDGVDELAQAQALWRRRFGHAPKDEKEKARQVRFLLARGYTPGIAYRVLRAAGASGEDEA
jgi:regulatory protein